jgi:hypothetical protein
MENEKITRTVAIGCIAFVKCFMNLIFGNYPVTTVNTCIPVT